MQMFLNKLLHEYNISIKFSFTDEISVNENSW